MSPRLHLRFIMYRHPNPVKMQGRDDGLRLARLVDRPQLLIGWRESAMRSRMSTASPTAVSSNTALVGRRPRWV
jgi:hypothetical protein